MPKKIAKVVVGLPVEGPFDYLVPEEMQADLSEGMRILIVFNRRKMLGYVVGFASESSFDRLNAILSVLDEFPTLDTYSLELARCLSAHYGCSLGEAIETMLPAFLRKKKAYAFHSRKQETLHSSASIPNELIVDYSLNLRWDHLLPKISDVMAAGRSVLCLFPENRLIKSAVEIIEKHVSQEIFVIDKKVSVAQEQLLWEKMLSLAPKIVIGTRSAIFSPLPQLGVIIVFDEENRSYKQEQTPYYHASEVAQMRSRIEGVGLMMVSSAPLAETWHQYQGEKYEKTELRPESVSEMKLVDLTNFNPRKTSKISFPLQASIEKTLKEKGRVLLFMNRKGFFTMTSCNECGYVLKCERCDVNLIYQYDQKKLVCKHCNFTQELPKFCPACKGAYLRSKGIGIEKLEREVARLYPAAKVGLLDKDTKRYPLKKDIVIATQAVLGLHGLFQADLVGVISFDAELNYFDFRSAQRAYSLLVKLRQMAKKTLLVQTSLMDNYTIQSAVHLDSEKFYLEELNVRKEIGLPPFKRLVYIVSRGTDQDEVISYLQSVYEQLIILQGATDFMDQGFMEHPIEISEPHPDVHPKLRDNYRFCIMLKGVSLKDLLALAKAALKKKRGKKSIISTVIVDY